MIETRLVDSFNNAEGISMHIQMTMGRQASRLALGLMFAMTLWLAAVGPADAAGAEPGLVLHYTFEEGAGNIYDKSPAKNNGTPYGATYVDMRGGHAMGFASKAAFAKCAHYKRLLFGQGDFTVELWLKLDATIPGSIINKKGNADQPAGWTIDYTDAGELAFTVADAQQQDTVALPMADTDGWHHLVAVPRCISTAKRQPRKPAMRSGRMSATPACFCIWVGRGAGRAFVARSMI